LFIREKTILTNEKYLMQVKETKNTSKMYRCVDNCFWKRLYKQTHFKAQSQIRI